MATRHAHFRFRTDSRTRFMSAQQVQIPSGDDAQSHLAAMRARVKGRNINEKTLLATDYLNHFNEIVMLIEMVPDLPEMIDDVKMWQPKTYPEHFADSGFSDKDLAIAAYEVAPAEYRQPFERTVGQIDRVIIQSLDEIQVAVDDGEDDELRRACTATVAILKKLIALTDAVIHGNTVATDQDTIDTLLDD